MNCIVKIYSHHMPAILFLPTSSKALKTPFKCNANPLPPPLCFGNALVSILCHSHPFFNNTYDLERHEPCITKQYLPGSAVRRRKGGGGGSQTSSGPSSYFSSSATSAFTDSGVDPVERRGDAGIGRKALGVCS